MNPVTGLSLGRIGVGIVALAQPALVSARLTPGQQAATPLMTQWFGSREIAVGAATLLTHGSSRRTLVLLGMFVDGADAATSYQAVRAKTLPSPVGMPAAGIAAGAVVAGLLGLRVKKKTSLVVEPA